jgi:regulation of enolase protein 1 (concanavalin A-like superfamily)
VSAEWARLYDQGGLYVGFPQFFDDGKKQAWLKTGIEFYENIPNLSTVSAREWADWSLVPLQESQKKITIELERKNSNDPSLWVYLVAEGEKRVGVREVTWAFEAEGELQIGVYAARPTENDIGGESLEVTFENFNVIKT